MPPAIDLKPLRIDLKGKKVTPAEVRRALIPAVLAPEREAKVRETTVKAEQKEPSRPSTVRLDVPVSATVRVLIDINPNDDCIQISPAEPRWYDFLGPVRVILFAMSFARLTRATDAVAHTLKKGLGLPDPVKKMANFRGELRTLCDCPACKLTT